MMNSQKLSVGLGRTLVVISVVWVIAFYIVKKDAIDLHLDAAVSTSNTTCSDVYHAGDNRLIECEAAGPMSWSDRFGKESRGEKVEVLFAHYQKANQDSSALYWLFGVPIALLALARAGQWIVAGFKADQRRSK